MHDFRGGPILGEWGWEEAQCYNRQHNRNESGGISKGLHDMPHMEKKFNAKEKRRGTVKETQTSLCFGIKLKYIQIDYQVVRLKTTIFQESGLTRSFV